jgi:hypothetical protein
MAKRSRTTQNNPVQSTEGGLTLRLTKREARRMERDARRAQPRDPRTAGLKGFLDRAAADRGEAQNRPGRRGWRGKAVGRVSWIEPLPEAQGTTVQVCGLWPFIAGSGSPVVGVPLGRHLLNGTTVCADPVYWFLSNLISQPSAFVLGRPGLGKSTLIRRMIAMLQAWGIVPMILSDTKPDYVDLIRAMKGQIITPRRGGHALNPLDLGPLLPRLQEIADDSKRREAVDEMRGRRHTMVTGLLQLVRNGELEPFEQSIVSAALQILDTEHDGMPVIHDLTELIRGRHPRLAGLAQDQGDPNRYAGRVEKLIDGLTALGEDGPFGDIFSRQTTEHIDVGTAMVFDLSAIDEADLQLQAAVQSVCWSYGSAVVSAEKHLAEAGLRKRRHYFLVMDELWRMLRASDVMVYFLDSLTRLNRQRGISQVMITHTMNDLELASPHLTKMAWGFVERSAMVFLGGLAEREMGNLNDVFAMSSAERSMITDWSSEGGINPDTSQASAPPGRGKFLLKVGKKPGIPFQLQLTSAELEVNDTNKAWAGEAERVHRNTLRAVTDAAELDVAPVDVPTIEETSGVREVLA